MKYYNWDLHKFISEEEYESLKEEHDISVYDVPEDSKVHLWRNRKTLCGNGDTPNLTTDETHVTCEKCIELMDRNNEIVGENEEEN